MGLQTGCVWQDAKGIASPLRMPPSRPSSHLLHLFLALASRLSALLAHSLHVPQLPQPDVAWCVVFQSVQAVTISCTACPYQPVPSQLGATTGWAQITNPSQIRNTPTNTLCFGQQWTRSSPVSTSLE